MCSLLTPPPFQTLVTRLRGEFNKKWLKHFGEQLRASEILSFSGGWGLRFQPGFRSFIAEEALLFALILERWVGPTKRKQDVGSSMGLTEVPSRKLQGKAMSWNKRCCRMVFPLCFPGDLHCVAKDRKLGKETRNLWLGWDWQRGFRAWLLPGPNPGSLKRQQLVH